MTKSALGTLNEYKKQLDAAKLQLEKANELMAVIEKLEVTLCMIPARGDGSVVAAMKDADGVAPKAKEFVTSNQASVTQEPGNLLPNILR